MACVQGTWWGVGGGVVGGWWGFWFWCRVSGWGWVRGLGCLVGGGVCLVGPGSWVVGGVGVWGLFPLDPSLTPAPPAWCAVVLGSGRPSVGWWFLSAGGCLVGCSSFLGEVGWSCGWLVLLAVFWSGCSQPGVVVAVLAGCSGSAVCLLGEASWLRALWAVCLSGGCSVAGCVVPVGWADLDGRALRPPPFSPPLYTTERPRPPDSVGELTR